VGVSKASSAAELAQAIDRALRFDTDVLIESAVPDARELEVAMLGEMQRVKASVVGEVIPDRDFYTYDSKYDSSSTTQTAIPANLTPEMTAKVQDYARKAFSVLHCQGLARVDFLLSSDGTLYLNEVNTMPGFTNISMYPKLWEASGRSYQELISILIDTAQ
jgi:D-alanine-D-alanine ligase